MTSTAEVETAEEIEEDSEAETIEVPEEILVTETEMIEHPEEILVTDQRVASTAARTDTLPETVQNVKILIIVSKKAKRFPTKIRPK